MAAPGVAPLDPDVMTVALPTIGGRTSFTGITSSGDGDERGREGDDDPDLDARPASRRGSRDVAVVVPKMRRPPPPAAATAAAARPSEEEGATTAAAEPAAAAAAFAALVADASGGVGSSGRGVSTARPQAGASHGAVVTRLRAQTENASPREGNEY